MPYAEPDPNEGVGSAAEGDDQDSSSHESQQYDDTLNHGSNSSGSVGTGETRSSSGAMLTPARPSKESVEDQSYVPVTPTTRGSGSQSQSGGGFVTPGGWRSMTSQSSCSCASCYCSDPSRPGPGPHCPGCGVQAMASPVSNASTSLESCSCTTCNCCDMNGPRGSPCST